MASYSSSQSGNFSASSTWGGNTPADGDTLTINHTVTIDTGLSTPTNGFGDITISSGGILTNADNTTLRVNGNLNASGGTIHFKDNLEVQFNGTAGDNHGLQVQSSAGSNLILEGDDPTGTTTTTAATDGDACTHSLTNASAFAIGDWIQIYAYDYTSTDENDGIRFQDEGFWIHDIDGNTVYTRDFVGPEDSTVTKARGTLLRVSNAKVFRKGQQIIFGTGSNRNIRTINSINYNRNQMILNSAITGSVVGQTVYRAMSLKPHVNGSKVRKMAAKVSTEAASGATTITLNGVGGLTAGDRIWIEKRSEAGSTTDYTDQNSGYDYVIQSISGNTLTLTSALNYKVVEGSLVSLLSRGLRFTTVATDGSDYYHLYVIHNSSYNRYIVLKDVEFHLIGDTDNNVRTGVVLRGQNKIGDGSNPVTYTQTFPQQSRGTWVEGLTIQHYPGHEADWGSLWLYDCRSAVARGCITLYGDDGISCYYEPFASIMGCIAAGQRSFAFRMEGSTEMFDLSYCYASRCNNRNRLFAYEEGIGGTLHNVISDANDYGGLGWYMPHPGSIWRCKFTGMRYGLLVEAPAQLNAGMMDSFLSTLSGLPTPDDKNGTPQAGESRMGQPFHGGSSRMIMSIEHNFENDAMRMYGFNTEIVWDNTETAWYVTLRYDNDGQSLFGETVFIPAGATARVTCKVKGVSGFSGTRPYLTAHDTRSAHEENALEFTATTNRPLRGKRYNVQYSSAFDSAYEEKQITITAEDYNRYYKIGVRSINRNAAEGYYVKDFNVYVDRGPDNPMFSMGNLSAMRPASVLNIRNSFTQPKRRIGGRLK
jgi:hypothetical protein